MNRVAAANLAGKNMIVQTLLMSYFPMIWGGMIAHLLFTYFNPPAYSPHHLEQAEL